MSWVLSKQLCHQLTCQTAKYLEPAYATWFWQWSCTPFLLCDRFESKHCIGECSKAYNILLFDELTMSLTFNSCASNLFKHFLQFCHLEKCSQLLCNSCLNIGCLQVLWIALWTRLRLFYFYQLKILKSLESLRLVALIKLTRWRFFFAIVQCAMHLWSLEKELKTGFHD